MRVTEAMTSDVETLSPDDTVAYAAARMRDLDVGFLPVAREGRALGVVTDRDIAVRCCAEGLDPGATPVTRVMTPDVIGCRDTADLSEATRIMESRKVRRLLITNAEGQIAGLLSVDDLATRMQDPSVFSRVLQNVALAAQPPRATDE